MGARQKLAKRLRVSAGFKTLAALRTLTASYARFHFISRSRTEPMRQGQQNRRGRGRSNRKGQSPLTRSFESTGPEVKIRGTPSHIAEKYMSLARDATSSGDPVLAENYLQHAEHYNRIIMAFRDQQIAQGGDGLNGGTMARNPMDSDDYGDDEGDDGDMQPQMGNDHQPRMDNQRYEGNRGSQDQNRHRGDREHHRNFNNNNNNRNDRNDNRYDRNDRNDRGPRNDRNDRGPDQQHAQPPRQPAPEGVEAAGGQPQPGGDFRRRDRIPQQQHEQPEFLRRPVRRPRRESGNGAPEEVNGAAGADEPDRD
jgi:hypothetical protein